MNKWILPLGVTLASLGLAYIARAFFVRRSLKKLKKKVDENPEVMPDADSNDFNAKLNNFLSSTAKSEDIDFKFKEAASLLRSLSRIPDSEKLNLYGDNS